MSRRNFRSYRYTTHTIAGRVDIVAKFLRGARCWIVDTQVNYSTIDCAVFDTRESALHHFNDLVMGA